MGEVLLATSARARLLVQQAGRARPGSPRLALGLSCPVCAAGVVAVLDDTLTAREALRQLQQRRGCLHASAEASAAA